MDKYERRRAAVVALAASLGYGGTAKIARAINKAPDYVSRMLYEAGKAGRKRIGEDTWDALVAAYPLLATVHDAHERSAAAARATTTADVTANLAAILAEVPETLRPAVGKLLESMASAPADTALQTSLASLLDSTRKRA